MATGAGNGAVQTQVNIVKQHPAEGGPMVSDGIVGRHVVGALDAGVEEIIWQVRIGIVEGYFREDRMTLSDRGRWIENLLVVLTGRQYEKECADGKKRIEKPLHAY